jgi:hypothetical protein
MTESNLGRWAAETARSALAEALPGRWRHVRAVAAKARGLAPLFDADGGILVAAAWLHDVGYSPAAAASAFHPLDGALYLRAQSAPERLCALVAHHSGAVHEARERHLVEELAGFVDEHSPLRDALWWCDMTTGPSGQDMTVDARLAEILQRYGPGHVVTRSISAATPDILRAAASTTESIRAYGYSDDTLINSGIVPR